MRCFLDVFSWFFFSWHPFFTIHKERGTKMQVEKNSWFLLLLTVVVGVSLLLLYPAASTHAAEKSKEGIPSNITYNVCKSAEITKVSYFFEKYKGKPRLHFEITIKNVSPEMKRFRVNIYLPEGPSSGGFYPRKGKGIEPGKTLTRKFPMYFDKFPSGFMLVVKEL